MREGRAVQFMGGVQHLLAEGRGRVLHQRDVIAELHREAAGRFDAGVGEQAKPLCAQCSLMTMSPACGTKSGCHSPPQVPLAKVWRLPDAIWLWFGWLQSS